MRKKLLIIFTLVFTFVSLVILKMPKEIKAESANGFHVEQVYSDKFNKEALDPSWTLNGATLELDYNGLHCISPVGYGHGPIINAVTLDEKTQIDFTIIPQSGQSETNISFNIGMASPTISQKEPDVDCKVQFWNDQLVFTDWQHNLAVNQELINEHVLRGFNGLFSSLLRTDVSLTIERKSNILTEIYAEYSRDGAIVYSSKSTPFKLNNPREPHGYCGFFWDAVEMDLTNFRVYNNDELVFEDDFSENTLTYPTTDPALGNFHINENLNESNCYISRVSSVKMDSSNESIKNSNALVKLENVTNPYELKYDIKFNKLNTNSFFGFGFGLSDGDTSIDKKNAIGFLKKDSLTAEIVVLKNGVIDRSNNYQVSLTKLGNGRYTIFNISFDASNNAYLSFSGLTYKFSNIDFYGLIAIGLVDLNSSESSSIEMREISIMRNVYNKYSSEDASNDFKGIIVPDETDPLYNEPYINDQKYTLGSGVSLEEDWGTGNKSLSFSNSTSYSSFCYAKEYSEWICEFDVELYTRRNNQMFGISFGRKSMLDVLVQASTSNYAYLFRCEGAQTGQITYGTNCKFKDGTTYKISPVNVFDEENNKYHMMFIGKNRNVYVYFKAEDAPESDLSILRAEISNVNIDGYVAIVGNNGISFNVTNFKIVNLSDACTQESELTIRESFNDKNNMSDKILSDGMSKVQDSMLLMNDSTLQTASQYLYEILRFSTYSLENNLQILFSGDKRIVFDALNNQVVIREGTSTTTYDASEINLKYIKGKRLEITIFGDQIKIGYKGYYDPMDKLSSTIITHTLDAPLSKDNIIFLSNGKTILDDLYLFALDNSKECLTLNYEDDPNNAPIWSIKPDFDPSKVYDPEKLSNTPVNSSTSNTDVDVEVDEKTGGCSSSISSVLVLYVLGILPVLTIKNKKEEK